MGTSTMFSAILHIMVCDIGSRVNSMTQHNNARACPNQLIFGALLLGRDESSLGVPPSNFGTNGS
jgi:hypothetical protein